MKHLYQEESSDDENDVFNNITLTPKEVAIRKIEFALADIHDQIEKGTNKLVLRTSFDNSHFQLKYFNHTRREKLKRDLYCLRQIYDLLINDKKSTKRELYYENTRLYKTQSVVDKCIQQLCELLNTPRSTLNIMACAKGILRGGITFISPSFGIIDARSQNVMISDELLNCNIINTSDFIIIIEKESYFQKLLDEQFIQIYPNCIIITAKGYPDICTRNVIRQILNNRNIPIFGLFDADPHGIEIYLTYKYGKTIDSFESRGAFISSLQWIGLFPSDGQLFPIEKHQFLPLSNGDFTKLRVLTKRCCQLNEHDIIQQIDHMVQYRFKLELECLNNLNVNYLIQFLIQPRICPLISKTA